MRYFAYLGKDEDNGIIKKIWEMESKTKEVEDNQNKGGMMQLRSCFRKIQWQRIELHGGNSKNRSSEIRQRFKLY